MSETQVRNEAAAHALTDPGTAAGDLIQRPALSQTRLEAHVLTEDIGGDRDEVRVLHERYDNLHKRSHNVEWRTATALRGKSSVATMLAELADLGFAWRDVARLVGVSVPAIQKWRRGEKASGDSRLKVASLLAACDVVAQHYMVDEIASWFEMPLVASAPVTPLDLYAAERVDLVFEFASGHADPEALLAEFDPDWRERYRSGFEVFQASDGQRSIQMKD